MRFFLGSAVLLLLQMPLPAAGVAPAGPFPLEMVQWHSDNRLITASGIENKSQLWILVDWSRYLQDIDKRPGQQTYWNLRWAANNTRTGDHRLFIAAVTTFGSAPGKKYEEVDHYVKALDGSAGLVKAFGGGDATGVAILVGPDGRITAIQRCGDDVRGFFAQAEKAADTAKPLTTGPADAPPSCAEALQFLKLGNTTDALALALKKLGPDGKALAEKIATNANTLIAEEVDTLKSAVSTAGERFLASRRLEALIKEFPRSPASKEGTDLLKDVFKKDEGVRLEAAAWEAYAKYLVQAGRQSPTKLADWQRQYIAGAIEAFPDTEAARILGMIRTCAKLDEAPQP